MIPILFDSNATQFDTNGLGRLIDCISCEVTEERNGVYECEFVYPIDGRNYDKITLERIIAVTHDDTQTLQPFVIYKKSVPINGQVTFNAHHISYRLANVVLEPYTAGSCAEALSLMPAHSINDNPFSFYTDKQTTANFKLAVPRRCKEILGGVEGSILDTFGSGEYEFDGFNVNLWQNRGSVTGVEIRYGKNLSDITDETDASGKCNAVIPFWQSSAGDVVVTLPELAVYADDAPLIYEYWTDDEDNTITDEHDTPIDFRYVALDPEPLDLSQDFETEPTITQLRDAAKKYLAENRTWAPVRNIELDFVQLWQTDEYASFAALERVKLCDTVRVVCPDGEDVRIKVVKTVYDVLLDRYSKMELGEPRATLAETIAEAASTAIATKVPTKSQMAEFITEATRKITGGLGGHVVIGLNANGEPNEILIMDTDNIETATNIIRLNEAGLGFSTNGGQTYANAWTIDGILNADYIRAGTLSGDVIKGGIIRSLDDSNGNSFWNLNTGRIQTAGLDSHGNTSILTLAGGVWLNGLYTPDGTQQVLMRTIGERLVTDSGTKYGGVINSTNYLKLSSGSAYILIKTYNSSYRDDDSYPFRIILRAASLVYGELGVAAGLTVYAKGITVTGNSSINGRLSVVGALTASSITSSGAASVGSITSNNKLTVSAGGVAITGNSTLAGKLSITMANQSTEGLNVYGTSNLRGALTVSNGGASITGATAVSGKLTVSTGGAAITGATTITGNLSTTGDMTLGGSLNSTLTIQDHSLLVKDGDTTRFSASYSTGNIRSTYLDSDSSSVALKSPTTVTGSLLVTDSSSAWPFIVRRSASNELFKIKSDGSAIIKTDLDVGGNTSLTGWLDVLDSDTGVKARILSLEKNINGNHYEAEIRVNGDSGTRSHLGYGAYYHYFGAQGFSFAARSGYRVTISDCATGSLYCEGGLSAASVTNRSDERLKDFEDWDDRYDEAFDAIEPRIFAWKKDRDKDNKPHHIGVSAQATRRALEDAGIIDSGIVEGEETETEYLNVDYNSIMMLAVKKIKDQQKQIDILMARLDALEGRLNADT